MTLYMRFSGFDDLGFDNLGFDDHEPNQFFYEKPTYGKFYYVA